MKVELNALEIHELIYALRTRRDWIKAKPQDASHGRLLLAAELEDIDELEIKLNRANQLAGAAARARREAR